MALPHDEIVASLNVIEERFKGGKNVRVRQYYGELNGTPYCWVSISSTPGLNFWPPTLVRKVSVELWLPTTPKEAAKA